MGRDGPFVQVGTKDDEEKPKFAGLRPGQKMDTIKLPEALELFKVPRKLGDTAEGYPIMAKIGPFGPYVQFATKGFVSLKPPDDPYTIELSRALELIEQKKIADANKLIQDFGVDNIKVLNGRYGPYITDGKRNARIPKDTDPKAVTLDTCRELLAAAPPRGSRFGRKKGPTTPAAASAGADKTTAAAPAAKAGKKATARTEAVAKPDKKIAAPKKKSSARSAAKKADTAAKKTAAKRKKS
jgi:DNA topoisomerase-1